MTRGVDIAMALVSLVCGLMILASTFIRWDLMTRREAWLDLGTGVCSIAIAAVLLWR